MEDKTPQMGEIYRRFPSMKGLSFYGNLILVLEVLGDEPIFWYLVYELDTHKKVRRSEYEMRSYYTKEIEL